MINKAPPASPMTRGLQWLKDNCIDLAFSALFLTAVLALLGYGYAWALGSVVAMILLIPAVFNRNRGTVAPVVAPPPPLPANPDPDMSRLRGRYRDIMQEALDGRRGINEAIEQTAEASQKMVLSDAVKNLPMLVNNIYKLALKAQSTSDSLAAGGTPEQITGEVQQLEDRISASNDTVLKTQYGNALDRKLQQLQNITDATVALRRMDAQLENALSTVDTLRSQIMRIESSQVLSYSGATDRLSSDLQEAVDSLMATANAMDNVYGWDQPNSPQLYR